MFQPQTKATTILKDGTELNLSKISIRATEFTVGENGLDKMPALLPQNTGYTYAVELSIDEAIEKGATKIIAPYGQITTLDINKETGYLNSLTLPMNRIYQMTYDTDEKEGLLKTFTKPNGGTNTFTYDDLGLLIKDTDAENGFKEITQTGVEGNGKVEVKSAMGRVTTYETTIAPQPPEGGVDTQVKIINYVYDTEKDQLTSVNLDNSTLSYEVLVSVVNPEIYPKLAELQYDGGLLLSESSSDYNSKLEWIYDDDLRVEAIKLTTNGDQLNPIAKVDEAGMILEKYIYGLKSNIPEYIVKNNEKYKIISNHLGSPTIIIKTSDNSIAKEIKHDSFGNIIEENGSFELIFGFAGGIWDEDTGFVRFGVRKLQTQVSVQRYTRSLRSSHYDGESGRWTSKEPLGFAGAREFYF